MSGGRIKQHKGWRATNKMHGTSRRQERMKLTTTSGRYSFESFWKSSASDCSLAGLCIVAEVVESDGGAASALKSGFRPANSDTWTKAGEDAQA